MRREEQSLEPAGEAEAEASGEVPLRLDAEEIVGRGRQGRDAWLREDKRQLEQHRWEHPDPISRAREERLLLAAKRLQSELDVERRANEAYEDFRATARDRLGRRPGRAASGAGRPNCRRSGPPPWSTSTRSASGCSRTAPDRGPTTKSGRPTGEATLHAAPDRRSQRATYSAVS
jgi:hypothetical protein